MGTTLKLRVDEKPLLMRIRNRSEIPQVLAPKDGLGHRGTQLTYRWNEMGDGSLKERRSAIIILIAEDDPDDCLLITNAFQENCFENELRFVEDGEKLMDYLHHRGGYGNPASSPRPGIVLLDLNMPLKNGREALEEIKSDPDLRAIPVVIFTTSREEKDILQSYDKGANSYITKPASFDGLVEAIKILGRYWFEIVALPSGVDKSGT
jgi:CheY-like chemotaxis protein